MPAVFRKPRAANLPIQAFIRTKFVVIVITLRRTFNFNRLPAQYACKINRGICPMWRGAVASFEGGICLALMFQYCLSLPG